MTELRPIPIGMQAYEARSPALRLELLENLYLEANPDGAKGQVALLGTPGLTLHASVGDGPIRGIKKLGANLFVVSGDELFYVDVTGAVTFVGTIGGSNSVCRMEANRTQVAICTSGPAYAATVSGIVPLPETDLLGVAYQDGYGIFPQRGGEDWFISALDDFSSISALDVTQADVFPDNVVGVVSDHREVVIFGEESIETYVNTGNPLFPFERTGSGFVEHGCGAVGSIAKAENLIFWLGDEGRVYVMSGYQAQPISTPAVEFAIASDVNSELAEAFTYTQEGHTFYVLSLPSMTLVYDLVTKMWHKRRSYRMDRWRAQGFQKIWRGLYVGDFQGNGIYKMDLGAFLEGSDQLERTMITPPFYASGKRMLFDELRLDCEQGVVAIDVEPKALLDWTNDFGRTWSNIIRHDLGLIGEYRRETKWFNLGSDYNRSMRIRMNSPMPVRILGLHGRTRVLAR